MHMMKMSAAAAIPDMRVSNDLLGDRAALEKEWQRSGYWYFKGVIPQDALDAFRRPVLDALKSLGVVDRSSELPTWNENSLDQFPKAIFGGYEALPGMARTRRWMDFLATPSVVAFFERALGAPANWVAVAELRVTPPGENLAEGLFTYPHQDGFYNEGYRCLTAWIPLYPVSKAAGGLAVAEGMHLGGVFHDQTQPPPCPIPPGLIPDDTWRTADYQPGDVVLFDRFLPHSGQRNRTERDFRVSFDVRCVLPGDPVPVFGNIEASSADEVNVRALDGVLHKFRLTDDSYLRGTARSKAPNIERSEVAEIYPKGQEVLITYEDDRVIMLREPKY